MSIVKMHKVERPPIVQIDGRPGERFSFREKSFWVKDLESWTKNAERVALWKLGTDALGSLLDLPRSRLFAAVISKHAGLTIFVRDTVLNDS